MLQWKGFLKIQIKSYTIEFYENFLNINFQIFWSILKNLCNYLIESLLNSDQLKDSQSPRYTVALESRESHITTRMTKIFTPENQYLYVLQIF